MLSPQKIMFGERTPTPRPIGDERDVARRRERRATSRDVVIPPIRNPRRRAACRLDLARFCLTYFPEIFTLPFSPDHHAIVRRLQSVVLHGRKATLVAPRGSGKTSITIATIIWAILYGHRRFCCIICDTFDHAVIRFSSIRTILETNDRLHDDFPGPTACIRALERKYNRGPGQTVTIKGERRPTHISMGGGAGHLLVLPTLPRVPSSSAAIAIGTLDSAIRGLQHTTASGEILRPDFVILDDPQDKQQANNPATVDKREQTILADVLGLAGPTKDLACVYLGTKIAKDDLTSRFSDAKLHPDWAGPTYKLMYALPTAEEHWKTYNDLRVDCLEKHGHYQAATDYYAAHRPEMDAGAKPAWEQRHTPRDISATQYAMNIIFDKGLPVFLAEYQNEPQDTAEEPLIVLSAYAVERADSELPRGDPPPNASVLVLGWDVGKYGIHWVATSIAPGRRATIIEYGMEPTGAPTGRIEDGDRTGQAVMEVALLGALRRLRDKFLESPYHHHSGEPLHPERVLIDARWMTDIVLAFCAESGPAYCPVMGHGTAPKLLRYFIPNDAAWVANDANLYVKPNPTGFPIHHVNSDAYKQQAHEGFLLYHHDRTAPGVISLFSPEHRDTHFAFARHITAEIQQEKTPGVITWAPARGRAANHWLDALCYSLAGVSLLEYQVPELGVTAGQDPTLAPRPIPPALSPPKRKRTHWIPKMKGWLR